MVCTIKHCPGCDVIIGSAVSCPPSKNCSTVPTTVGDYSTLVGSGDGIIWALMLVVASCISAPWLMLLFAELKVKLSPYAVPALLTVVLATGVVLLAIHLDQFRDLLYVSGKEKFGNSTVYATLVVVLLIVPSVLMLVGVTMKRPPLMYAGAGAAGFAGLVMLLVYQPKSTLQAHHKELCDEDGSVARNADSHFGSMLATAGFGALLTAVVGVAGVFVLTKYAPVAALR